jgi:hypothetical protein
VLDAVVVSEAVDVASVVVAVKAAARPVLTHACAFHRADMNKNIFVAVIRLNEAEAFLIIKPHYSSRVHGLSLYLRFLIPRR